MKKVRYKGKCRTWKLKDEAVQKGFRERIRASEGGRKKGGEVEGMWSRMNGSMLKAAEEVCGMTKGHPGIRKRGGGMKNVTGWSRRRGDCLGRCRS